MARYSANLAEVGGSDAYILEISLEDGEHPVTRLDLEEIGKKMGESQLYVRTGDVAGMQGVMSQLEREIDLERLPALLLLSEPPVEAESAGIVYCDRIESEEEARILLQEVVQKLHDPEFMAEHRTWQERMDRFERVVTGVSIVGRGIELVPL